MKNFLICFVLTDEANTLSVGLALVGYLLHQTKLDQRLNELRFPHVCRDVHNQHSEVILSLMDCFQPEKPISIISKRIVMMICLRADGQRTRSFIPYVVTTVGLARCSFLRVHDPVGRVDAPVV